MKGMINVVKEFLKKIIVFIIPFLFVLNIYAAEGKVLTYKYKVVGKNNVSKDYIITVSVENEKVNKITMTEYSSDQTGVGDPKEPLNFDKYLDKAGLLDNNTYSAYGITDYAESLEDIFNYGDNVKEFYEKLVNNPENYKPILKFNKNGDPLVIGFEFNADAYEETINNETNNLNDCSGEMIEKFLNGKLTVIKPNTFIIEDSIDFYEKLNIDSEVVVTFTSATAKSYDIDNKSNTISFTGGTCEGYNKGLRDMREALTGYVKADGTEVKGICSSNSLNAMQRVASLYDLENNFDRSVLEDECSEFVFGENGYINRLVEAQTYYQSIPYDKKKPMESAKYKLVCLSAQSEYLKGLSLLTFYTPVIDEADKSGCDLIGKDVIDFINDLFDIIKILCICVCVLLCITDIYKMVVTKESDISKFKKVLVKRIIALVAVFLIPLFINIVTDLINDRYLKTNSDKCTNVIRK